MDILSVIREFNEEGQCRNRRLETECCAGIRESAWLMFLQVVESRNVICRRDLSAHKRVYPDACESVSPFQLCHPFYHSQQWGYTVLISSDGFSSLFGAARTENLLYLKVTGYHVETLNSTTSCLATFFEC